MCPLPWEPWESLYGTGLISPKFKEIGRQQDDFRVRSMTENSPITPNFIILWVDVSVLRILSLVFVSLLVIPRG